MVDCLTSRWPIERVILFGSRARGDNRVDSDYDLLVVVPDHLYSRDLKQGMFSAVNDVNLGTDVIVTRHSSFERFKDIIGTIQFEAAFEGVEVYDRG